MFPAGAIESDTTFRIAVDSTGAPPMPADFGGTGNIYVITPHGGEFAQSVEVRIPAPAMTLQSNQLLKLAKAEPGGEWTILDDTEMVDGKLSTQVRSFSYFRVVAITYLLPIASAEPFRFIAAVSCGNQDCGNLVGPATVTYTVRGNGGQFPPNCTNPFASVQTRTYGDGVNDVYMGTLLSGFTLTQTLSHRTNSYSFNAYLQCSEGFLGASSFTHIQWPARVAYPAVAVERAPAQLDVVEGLQANLDVLVWGGAILTSGPSEDWITPTSINRAIVDWQRSDDGGASWRQIARSFQNEADPLPFGTGSGVEAVESPARIRRNCHGSGRLDSRARLLHAAGAHRRASLRNWTRNPYQCAAAERTARDRGAAALRADSHRGDG